MGIRRVTSSSPCLILVMRVKISLLKSASGANKFISVLNRLSMKLQGKPGGCMSVKTKLFERLQSRGADAWRPDVTYHWPLSVVPGHASGANVHLDPFATQLCKECNFRLAVHAH
eukprot:1160355-Pelagomonas_calceolata.AAC.7